jgi:hypothetical protein
MYNSGGSNGGNNYNRNSYTTRSGSGVRIGGVYIKPLYLYIGLGAAVLLLLAFLIQFINTHILLHFGVFAGALLLLANVRELLGQSYERHSNTALLNTMVGGALVFAWLSQFLGGLMWIPAIALLAFATPLAVGRASVYATYTRTARSMLGQASQVVSRTASRWTQQ